MTRSTAERSGVTRAPLTLSACAWWGEQLVAESTQAVVLTEPNGKRTLLFPHEDVHHDLLLDEGRFQTCPDKGRAKLWSLPGTVARPGLSSWGGYGLSPTVDGTDGVFSYTEPADGLAWLDGLVGFEPSRVRLQVIDPMGSQDPRDQTAKHFPPWGDARDLIDLLQVRPLGAGRFESAYLADSTRPVVEGSQMLGQAIVAATQQEPDRRVVSAHMVFVRGADARQGLELEVETLSAGRTFTSSRVQVFQGGRLCAAATMLLDATAPDTIRHAVAAPVVPGPYDLPSFDMGVTGRDLRVVDTAYTADPDAPVGPPILDCWVRFASVPDAQPLHSALLAQFTGHLSLAAAMRPHAGVGEAQAHRSLSTGINAISISFHAPIRADRWMLYHHESTFAGDGMTHSECRVHDEAGTLLASFTVEAMVRGFADPSRQFDDRTAM